MAELNGMIEFLNNRRVGQDNIDAIRTFIDANGGRRNYMINWEWAHFSDADIAKRVFTCIERYCDHRGFHDEQPESANANLQQAGFRFRW